MTLGTKWLAGALLGLPLAMALVTLAVLPLPGGWKSGAVVAIIVSLPLWVAIFCGSVMFRSSRAAWLWLALANAVCYGALWALRSVPAAGL
ncbi:hypothetical protein [Paracidovorax citrulli]